MTIALLEALTFGLGRLADAASDAGHRLSLLTGDRSTYTYELSRLGADQVDVLDVDTTDIDRCAAALGTVPDLAGLISFTDRWALPGAELASRLGLPGPNVETVRTIRDKGAVRALLHQYGLSPTTAIPTEPTAEAAKEVASTIGLPLVLKDSAGTASRYVWLARDEHELDQAVHEAKVAPLKGHLIAEPYFVGPLYSAETLTWDGSTRLLGITSRLLAPEPLRREEAAAFPVAFLDDDYAALEKWTSRVLAAVGFHQGFTHTEFVHTVDGPEVVEINGRLGGTVLGEAMCRSLGTNVYSAMISMALGERPALLDADLKPGSGLTMVLVYPPETGIFNGWSGLDRLSTLPGNPEWLPVASPGDHIEHLSDQRGCTALLLAEGATAELALYNALTAAGSITHHMTPAPAELEQSGAG